MLATSNASLSSIPQGNPTARLEAVDIAKGIGIVLVVVGHTLRGLSSAQLLNGTGVASHVDAWIYAFHMPLFFALSGFTLPNAMTRPFGGFFTSRLTRLGYPYLVWGSLQACVQVAASRYTNNQVHLADVWRIVYLPPMQFWFIYALFLISLLLGALWKLGLRQRGLLWVGAVLLFTAPYVPVSIPWGVLYQARDNVFFVALGASGIVTATLGLSSMRRSLLVAIGFGIVTGVAVLSARLHLPAAIGVLTGVAGTVATLALSSLRLPDGLRATFRYLGQRSMEIFVAHTIASAGMRIVLNRVLHVNDSAVHVVLGILVGVVAPVMLHALCKRLNMPYVFAWTPKRMRPAPQLGT